MATTRLKLTASDLKDIVNPTDDPKLFRYGNDPKLMSEEKVEKLMEMEEGSVLSACPEHYRKIASGKADGQYLTDRQVGASAGQTEFYLAFFPVVPGSVRLYLNYDRYGLPWRSRGHAQAMAASGYTVDNATGKVTLATGLSQGDVLLADYRHDAGEKFQTLRSLVLKSCRKELYVMFPNWTDASEVVEAMRDEITEKLLTFTAGEEPSGVSEIDDVDFLVETRKSNRATIYVNSMRGGL